MSNLDPGIEQLTDAARPVTNADYPYFKDKLQARMHSVQSGIVAARKRWQSEQQAAGSGQIHDLKDDAFASGLAHAELAGMAHELAEIRDIESAQYRILQAQYGRCVDCGEAISWRRLDAFPTAKRCVACQERLEHPSGAAARSPG